MDDRMTGPQTAPRSARTVLVFGVGKEEYAIEVGLVQELRSYGPVTRLANASACLMGLTNLRGVIVPLVDLRIRFGRSAPSYDASTVVVILNFGRQTVGIVVDRVADVLTLAPQQVCPAPRLGGQQGADHVLGIATVDERMLVLIDIVALLSDFDLAPPAVALPLAA